MQSVYSIVKIRAKSLDVTVIIRWFFLDSGIKCVGEGT